MSDIDQNKKPFKVSMEQVQCAFERVKANKGSDGIDDESIQMFESHLDKNLYWVWNRMASGSYFPPAVRAISIPKKSGGKRVLGIPTVRDRIAQTVVRMQLEPDLEKVFHANSYGFRPGRSAHQAIEVTRKRCWEFDWVVEFDIRRLFDNLDHALIMRALRHHTQSKWILLYVGRWLAAPMVNEDGVASKRDRGAPQGGPLSPLLANLFLHYAFDAWMQREYPALPFCRYADDGLIHCRNETEARGIVSKLSLRLRQCDLEIHPDKTAIVYCRDSNRLAPNTMPVQFTFLGYTFRPRRSKSRSGRIFANFLPAISREAEQAIRLRARKWSLVSLTFLSLQEVAKRVRPYIQGWMNYYCKFYRSQFQRIATFINNLLVRWAMRKFKRLRGRVTRSRQWLERLAAQKPELFPHWRDGFRGCR